MPERPALIIPPAPVFNPQPVTPRPDQIGTAPLGRAITAAPVMKEQKQQAISGDTFNKILPSIRQYESTTGRRVGPQALRAFSEQEFETAANRAAQNKALALQEHGLDIQKWSTQANIDLAQADQELRRYGMNSENLWRGADMALRENGQNAQIALQQYAQQLQALGMTADDSYRWADMAMRERIGNRQINAQEDAAQQAAIGQLIGLGGFLGASYMTGQSNIAAANIMAGAGGAGTTAAGTTAATTAAPAATTAAPVAATPALGPAASAGIATAGAASFIDAQQRAYTGDTTQERAIAVLENPLGAQVGGARRALTGGTARDIADGIRGGGESDNTRLARHYGRDRVAMQAAKRMVDGELGAGSWDSMSYSEKANAMKDLIRKAGVSVTDADLYNLSGAERKALSDKIKELGL